MTAISNIILASLFQIYSVNFGGVPLEQAQKKSPDKFITYLTTELSTGKVNAYSFDPFPFKATAKAELFRADWNVGLRLNIGFESPFYGDSKAKLFKGHLFYYLTALGKAEVRAGVIQNPLFAEEHGPFMLRGHGMDFRGKEFVNYYGAGTYYDVVVDFVPASGIGVEIVNEFSFGLMVNLGYMFDEKAFFFRTAYQSKMGKLLIRPEITFISFNPETITFERNEAYTTGLPEYTFSTTAMSIFEFKTLAMLGNLGGEFKLGFFNFRKGQLADTAALKGNYINAGVFYTIKLSEKGLIRNITIRDDISLRGTDMKDTGNFMNSATISASLLANLNAYFSWSFRIPENSNSDSKSYVSFGVNYSTSF